MILLSIVAFVPAIMYIEPTNILTIDDVAEEIRATELPKIYFDGEISDLKNKKEERKISVKYESFNKTIEAFAKIKLQGTSSLNYEKKNYTITFYKDVDFDNKFEIDFGWGKQSKYCLKANWIDKTHARNIVTARIASTVQNKYGLFNNTPHNGTVDGTPIEVYLNNDFLGLYTLNIPKDEWMFSMDKDNENHIVLSGNDRSDGNLFTGEASFDDWEVEVGEENDETLKKLSRLSDFVRNSSDDEFKNNFGEYFNLDSVLNYFILMEFAELEDNLCKNMLLVTYDGKIWYTSLYDLDSSWGGVWNGKSLANYSVRTTHGGSYLWERVEKNFPNELADRYFELRKEILTYDNVMNEFNKFNNSIPIKSFQKEQARWENIPGYDLEQIEEFLEARIPMIDEFFSNLYTYEKNITVVYKKNSNGTVTAKLKNIRNDIILYNGDTYTFKENGIHVFYFSDYLGDNDFIIAEVNGIKSGFY